MHFPYKGHQYAQRAFLAKMGRFLAFSRIFCVFFGDFPQFSGRCYLRRMAVFSCGPRPRHKPDLSAGVRRLTCAARAAPSFQAAPRRDSRGHQRGRRRRAARHPPRGRGPRGARSLAAAPEKGAGATRVSMKMIRFARSWRPGRRPAAAGRFWRRFHAIYPLKT
jgi:hypothetical protein